MRRRIVPIFQHLSLSNKPNPTTQIYKPFHSCPLFLANTTHSLSLSLKNSSDFFSHPLQLSLVFPLFTCPDHFNTPHSFFLLYLNSHAHPFLISKLVSHSTSSYSTYFLDIIKHLKLFFSSEYLMKTFERHTLLLI